MVERVKDEIKKLQPRAITFEERIKEDKTFLIALIDDPAKALRMYGYDSDDELLNMMNAMSVNVRERAVLIFREIGGLRSSAKGCEACDGCRICKACGRVDFGGRPGDPRI